MFEVTPELRKKLDDRNAAIAAEEARIAAPRRQFQNLVGERYLNCRFENFEATTKAMRDCRDACQAFASNINAEIDAGRSLVLAGPVGTGKDHLMAAVLREALKAHRTCGRVNGADLAGNCRDLIDQPRTEHVFLQRWAGLDVFAVSDPDGTREKTSDFYFEWLWRIVDHRYRFRKSLLMTINASNGREIATRIGERTWDRIQHGATIVRTDWRTHRKAMKVVNPPQAKDGKAAL